MPSDAHTLRLLTPTVLPDRTYRVVCSCGWESLTSTSKEAALREADRHVREHRYYTTPEELR